MKNTCYLVIEPYKDELSLEDAPYYNRIFFDKDKLNEYVKAQAKFLALQHNEIFTYTTDEVKFNG